VALSTKGLGAFQPLVH